MVDAWEKAGAVVGWVKSGKLLYFVPRFEREDGLPGELPGFAFITWNAKALPELPAPDAPFGLELPFHLEKPKLEGIRASPDSRTSNRSTSTEKARTTTS